MTRCVQDYTRPHALRCHSYGTSKLDGVICQRVTLTSNIRHFLDNTSINTEAKLPLCLIKHHSTKIYARRRGGILVCTFIHNLATMWKWEVTFILYPALPFQEVSLDNHGKCGWYKFSAWTVSRCERAVSCPRHSNAGTHSKYGQWMYSCSIPNLGTRLRWGFSFMHWPLYPRGDSGQCPCTRDLVGSRASLDAEENRSFRSLWGTTPLFLSRPVGNKFQHRLSHPVPSYTNW
jgi:hypothetical protein